MQENLHPLPPANTVYIAQGVEGAVQNFIPAVEVPTNTNRRKKKAPQKHGEQTLPKTVKDLPKTTQDHLPKAPTPFMGFESNMINYTSGRTSGLRNMIAHPDGSLPVLGNEILQAQLENPTKDHPLANSDSSVQPNPKVIIIILLYILPFLFPNSKKHFYKKTANFRFIASI